MRVLLQRVKKASVDIEDSRISEIEQGFLLLVGVTSTDTEKEATWLAKKIAGLRVFEDEEGKLNLSIKDIGGAVLVVSQFTLYGDTRKGKRPSFTHAAPPEIAKPLCDFFADQLRQEGLEVGEGEFGAMMMVNLQNDGPVTLLLEKEFSS